MGGFLGKQPQKEYFYYHMDGLWWWEVGYEWWYFDEARPTAQKLVVVLCLECIWAGCCPPTSEEWEEAGLVHGGNGKHVMSEELDRQSLEQGLEEVGRRAS